MIFIGIDPGAKGALAIIGASKRPLIRSFHKMSPIELAKCFTEAFCTVVELCKENAVQCVIENVHAMPHQGVSSMFTFGRNFGLVEGLGTANFGELVYVRPNQWQKLIGITYPKGTTYKERKMYNLRKSMKLYPKTLKLNTDSCDALLLAHYGKLVWESGALESESTDRRKKRR